MGYDYDRLYAETPDALGAVTPKVLGIIAGLGRRPLRVLDLGCGQGRDALPLARLGHRVHGVDLSPHGVAQMCAAAEREGLPVTGEVADLGSYAPNARCDLLLIDRTLHMLPAAERIAVLNRVLPSIARGGHVLILDEPANIPALARAIAGAAGGWQVDRPDRATLLARR